jgi:autotransporter-associated beta strand protein
MQKARFLAASAAAVMSAGVQVGLAASGAWTGAESALWTNSANWSAAPYPGSATGETAVFDGAGNGHTVIDLSGLAGIRWINFDTPAAAAYTLGAGGAGGQTLVLENAARLEFFPALAAPQLFDAALQLGTNRAASTYVITNRSPALVTLAGGVAGAPSGGTAGAKNLHLGGNMLVSGVIANGGASSLPLTIRSGTSYTDTVTFAASNTFTGNLTVHNGVLVLKRNGALGSGTKTVAISNAANNARPSIHLDGSEGDLDIPSSVSWNTSNSKEGALVNIAGNNTVRGNFSLIEGDGDTWLISRSGKVTFTGNFTPNANSARGLHLRGDAGGEITGVIASSATVACHVRKSAGAGTWTLSGADTYTGYTEISAGALEVSDANGRLINTSEIRISNGATLRLRNTAAANRSDRLPDIAPVTSSGGAFDFANDGSAADFNETAGPLVLTAGHTAVTVSPASSGHTAALTFSGFSRAEGATIDFSIGTAARVFLTGQPEGLIGFWATFNGSPAFYSSAVGVYAGTAVPVSAKGDTIPNAPAAPVTITAEGTTGPDELAAPVTTVGALVQASPYAATVNTAGKTLDTTFVVIEEGGADLTLGVAPNDGTVTASGGELVLLNDSAAALTVNALVADPAAPLVLRKSGSGAAYLAASNTFNGLIKVEDGALFLSHPLALQNITLKPTFVNGLFFDPAVASHAFTVAALTNTLPLTLEDTAGNPVTLSAFANIPAATFAGGLTGSGTLVKDGDGTLILNGANYQTGALVVNAGTVTVQTTVNALGQGDVVNNGVIDLTRGNYSYPALSNSISGTGIFNVTLASGTGTATANGDASGFTGIWNVGVTSAGGKLNLSGADNPAATVNVLTNAAVYVTGPVTKHATAVLHGGNTGESYGQLRLDDGAEWAGPVWLAGDITDAADGFFGNNSGLTGTVSGVIADLPGTGSHPVTKVGPQPLHFTHPANTYTGPTWLRRGALMVASLRNAGEPSSVGAATGSDAVIKIGTADLATRLSYTGTGDTTDRPLELLATTGSVTLEQNGTGPLTFTSGLTISGAGNKTFQLSGSGEGRIESTVAQPASGTVTLIKSGTGRWTLAGPTEHTGDTQIQNGTLVLSHPQAAGSSSRLYHTGAGGTLELGYDPAGMERPQYTVGSGFHSTLLLGTGTDGIGRTHTFNNFNLASATVTVSRADSVTSGTPAVEFRTVNLGAGGAGTGTLVPTDVEIHIGNASITGTSAAKTLALAGETHGNTVTGQIAVSINTLSLVKGGPGTWTLSGTNTYTGRTTVDDGTLVLSGADGALSGTAGLALSGGAALVVSNAPAANNPDRLNDAAPVALDGGALDFAHPGGAADYSETIGSVTAKGGSAIQTSQADETRTSALTLGGLASSDGGTVSLTGPGLGESDRNRLFIAGFGDCFVGIWAAINGAGPVFHSAAAGVHIPALTQTPLAARGDTIPDDPAVEARITAPGTTGPDTLAEDTTRVALLRQASDTSAVVDFAGKALRTHGVGIEAGGAALTLGAAPGDGVLTALADGGRLDLANASSENRLTVNAALSDNAEPISVSFSGPGETVLAGPLAFTGPAILHGATLTFGSETDATLSSVVEGNGAVAKSGTNLLHILSANTYTGPTHINEGIVRVDQNAPFGPASGGGVVVAPGATLDVGCTPDVGGTRGTNSLNLGTKQFTVSGSGVNGQGAIVNSAAIGQQNALQRVALAGDTRFGGSARWDIRNGTFDMNGYTLTKVGNSYFMITSATVNPGDGHIDMASGIIRLESSTRLNGGEANTLTVRSGAELELYRLSNPQLWNLVLEEGSSFEAANSSTASTHNRWDGPVTLGGAVALTGGSGFVADIKGRVSGPGGFTKTGASFITISGTTNTYAGQTRITNGRLVVSSLRNVGEPSSLGQPATVEDGAIVIGNGTTANVSLEYAGEGDTSDRVIKMGGTTGGAHIYHNGTGPLKLGGDLGVDAAGSKTLVLRGTSLQGGEFAGNIANAGGNTISVTKSDAGRWTLSGTNTFTGSLNVNNGTLVLTGSNHFNTGSVTLVGSAAGDATLRMPAGSFLGGTSTGTGNGNFQVGNYANGNGAFYLEGGIVRRTPATGTDSAFGFGRAAGAYGYLNMSAGDITITRLQLGHSTGTAPGIGVGRVTGGTMKIPEYIVVGRHTNSVGVLTVDGGVIDHTGASQNVVLGWVGGRGELNLTGGLLDNAGRSVTVRESNGNPTGIVNLCAGTLALNAFTNYVNGTMFVNLAGGTLKAGTADSAAFLPSAVTRVHSYGPYSGFAGGAVIDTAGRNVTVSAQVAAPAGQGLAAVTLANGGSGYIGEPYVEIRGGGGAGACAVANLEDDGTTNGTYRVASVTVTCPGWGYTSEPAVTFLRGGSAVVVPTVAAVTLAPNTSGSLTKLGNGTLTLSAANTYTGTTAVAGGTLKLGHAQALPAGSPVTLAGGTLDLNGHAVANSLTMLSGSVVNGSLGALVLSPGGEGALGTDALTLTGVALTGGTYFADVTEEGASDLVEIQGDVDLAGLTLQLVDPGRLNRRKTYTLLTCSGALTGRLTAANLPDERWRLSHRSDGTVRLVFIEGTTLFLK